MAKTSVNEIIVAWLRDCLKHGIFEVTTHELEDALPRWGMVFYGQVHTPSTYSRRWRNLRQYLTPSMGLTITDVSAAHPERKEKTWHFNAIAS